LNERTRTDKQVSIFIAQFECQMSQRSTIIDFLPGRRGLTSWSLQWAQATDQAEPPADAACGDAETDRACDNDRHRLLATTTISPAQI